MRRCHSISSLIPHRHSQTHSQRSCLGHTTFFMHGDGRVHSVPRFQPGIDPLIGHLSRNGKMPVYRAPCICSPIHPDTTTSMARGPSAKPPHPSFSGIPKRRTSSRYQSEGRQGLTLQHLLWAVLNNFRRRVLQKSSWLNFDELVALRNHFDWWKEQRWYTVIAGELILVFNVFRKSDYCFSSHVSGNISNRVCRWFRLAVIGILRLCPKLCLIELPIVLFFHWYLLFLEHSKVHEISPSLEPFGGLTMEYVDIKRYIC